jgi:hypothetical protein
MTDLSPALHRYLQDQQSTAVQLEGVLEALAILDNEKCAPGAVTALIVVAGDLASQLNIGLDSLSLGKVRA